ncbi:MAG TPA: UDP-N-acetylmuramoyl-L-alanine--D-glutamate ligase [Ignavibacteria bacterium]|nr:UDP-N-acetylmuramoyl-L-alanine--D-glutamate ligase [Ignavibacteria bacterium]
MNITNKKVSIIGAARSGIGAAKLVKKLGGIPFVSDKANKEIIAGSIEILKQNEIEFETGQYSDKIFDCDLLVVSPGVPSDAEVLKIAQQRNLRIISEIEFAWSVCKGKLIAITGTNGKTTTTSLCSHVFNNCGIKSYIAGNIGTAFSEIALNVQEDEFVVLEVSSFQLDFIDDFKPKIAMILNITPDHLNRYQNNFDNYIQSKLRIYKNQDENDFLILNRDDSTLNKAFTGCKSNLSFFSLKESLIDGAFLQNDTIVFKENGKLEFSCKLDDIYLKGEHNHANAMAVINAAKLIDLDNNKIIEALKSFKGIEHRLEFVREIDGVKYINDSKATNVDSVWYALKSFDEPIFLILGGQDKGNDYNKIKDLAVEKVEKIYAIGESAEKIFNFFHNLVRVEIKLNMADAVLTANMEARENEIVLLSPACASFDMFENYEHRGKVFKEAVNRL